MLSDERQGCLSQQATVSVAHTHSGFVHIQTFLLQVAKLEAGHDVVVCFLRIKVLGTRLVGGERSDTVDESLLYEVVTQVHIVLLTYGECHIERTLPVALCQHLEHHEVVLVERVFSCQ